MKSSETRKQKRGREIERKSLQNNKKVDEEKV